MRALLFFPLLAGSLFAAGFQSTDGLKIRSIGTVRLSPDATKIAYTINRSDLPGRGFGQLYVMTIATGQAVAFSEGNDSSGDPIWSPDGKWIAYSGKLSDRAGLLIARPDASGKKFLTTLEATNSPLPTTGARVVWSPDSTRIAFVTAQPGPETADATGDPVVITRYLYKPDLSEGNTRFNDNKRLHIFVLNIADAQITQLTSGNHYEHSIDWSRDGKELLYVSNREPNEDQFFNYDMFTLGLADHESRRITSTENAEYRPRWSPDGKHIAYEGTKRGLTDLETTMEDTHVWIVDADGKNRHELSTIDNRQGEPVWSSDGRSVYFNVQERGYTRLYRTAADGTGKPVVVAGENGSVNAFSTQGNRLVYAMVTPGSPAELFVKEGDAPARQLTDVNKELFATKKVEKVESIQFISNDNKWTVEAFLTYPASFDPLKKYPMVVNIHGGPHGQQGTAFNLKNQVYSSHGWATLMVNYRGSTGYGQAFTDAVFADQNGNEGQDVLYAVSAAIRRNQWLDRDRLGIEGTSYGGQLSAWLITQTNMFKAAIPTAAIINLISYNYMTYYNQYEQMEWGAFPHQGNLMDVLWERSALKHVASAHTPTLLMHGENDNDVPIAEAEQFYIALKDVGTDTVMVRYPREGHGIREPKHVVDWTDRSIAWYEKYFK